MAMDISDLKFETEWIRRIDEFFVLDVSGRALWAVFEGSIDKIPPEVTDALDVSCDDSVPFLQYWTAYNDATDEELKAAKYFRYIIMAN